MKLHVLDLGRLRLDPNILVSGAVMAMRSNPEVVSRQIEVPVSGYCIEHPDGHILFDMGCHPKAMGPEGRWQEFLQELCPLFGGEECELPNRLQQIGLGPDDIRYAVLSHLHNDHAGCVEFFRKSQIIVHEDEFSAAFRSFGLRQQVSGYVLKDMAEWSSLDLNWRLVAPEEGDLTLVEGVEILNLGIGHAAGMLALHVRLRETGSIILASDAVYCAQNYNLGRMSGTFLDMRGVRLGIRRIRNLAELYDAQVWYGHDLDQFATLRKSTEGPYE
jgi:N-acyl homoserine lactone hydrolase